MVRHPREHLVTVILRRSDFAQVADAVIETVAVELDEVTRIVRDAMENVAALKVPLLVDVHHGKNWALAK